MRKTTMAFFVGLMMLALCSAVLAADAVEPESLAIEFTRGEAETYASSVYYFEGTTLRLTNCFCWADSAGTVTQGLDGVTISVDVGNTTTNISYSGTVHDTNDWLWAADVIVPADLSTVFLQLTLTDASTNVFIYPWKYIRTKEPM